VAYSAKNRRQDHPDPDANALGGPIASAIAAFGRAVATKMGRGGEREDQLRAPAEALLRQMGQHIGVDAVPYGEVRLKDLRARPDYAVDVDNSRVGYIELKAPGHGVPLAPGWRPHRHEREQWNKLRALPNVIYTDGIVWCRYRYGHTVGQVVRLEGGLDNLREPLRPSAYGFRTLINDFLLWQPEKPRSLGDLITIVARLCELLHDEVYSILTGTSDHAAHEDLTLLAGEWRELLYPGLDDDAFADAFAQTVTFSLLLARTDGISFTEVSVNEIARRLAKNHSLIGRAFAVLTDGPAVDELSTIETLRRVIGVWVWQRPRRNDANTYAELYERFLAAYDPHLRKKTGSFYTPPRLARFMTNFVDEILRVRLKRPWGFADDVFVLDPAMGTGTFLLEIVRRIAETISRERGTGAVPDYLHDVIHRRLIGFEIQAAPYVVAELQLHDALKYDFFVRIPRDELRFLTDALANPTEQQQSLGALYRLIELAREKANYIKRAQPVMVVIGNPPHVENAKGRAPWIEMRRPRRHMLPPEVPVDRPSLDEFRADAEDHGRYESDLHGMPWYFWRWACWKVFEAHEERAGIVAFITPSSFLRGRAFAGMREYLRRYCDEGWIIDLSPEGNRPPTLSRIFGPEIGRQLCVAIFARHSAANGTQPAEVHYMPVHGSRNDKLDRLDRTRVGDPDWTLCESDWTGTFLPISYKSWAAFPKLEHLLPWRSRGVTPGRTWVYAPTSRILKRRWHEFIAASDIPRRTMFSNRSKERTIDQILEPLPGFEAVPRPLSAEHGECAEPIQVAYRSFDRQWIIPDSRLMTRARPPLWYVRSNQQVYVSEQDAHGIERGPGLVFTALIPDLHHFSGWGGGGVRPLYRDPDASVANIAPGLLELLSARLGAEIAPIDVLAYIAAVVAHPGFTARFREELRQPGIRVPLSSLSSVWARAISIGRQILWLHTFGTSCEESSEPRLNGERAIGERYGIRCLTAVTEVPDRIPDELDYDERSRTLFVGGGSFGPVPKAVVHYTVDGRRILWRWLNDRALSPRNKRQSSPPLDEIGVRLWSRRLTDELLALLAVLAGCVELEPEQLSLLSEICDGPLISVNDLRGAGVVPVDHLYNRPPHFDDSEDEGLFRIQVD
jgi:hypothetical protein